MKSNTYVEDVLKVFAFGDTLGADFFIYSIVLVPAYLATHFFDMQLGTASS